MSNSRRTVLADLQLPTLYVGAGSELVQYDLDVASGTMVERGHLGLPGNVDFAWPHVSEPVLYVACSNPSNGSDPSGGGQWACAVRLDHRAGTPSLLGSPMRLPHRAIHVTTDRSGGHLLLAHHRPAGLTVLAIGPDGALGAPVEQRPDLELGVFPHQVRVSPDGAVLFCVARGVPDMAAERPALARQLSPGSVTSFTYHDGKLGEASTITLGDGHQFGPRNLDFHPTGPWVYLALETQNEIVVLERDAGGRLNLPPQQRIGTLAHPDSTTHQGLGPILVHPQGHVVYAANRGYEPKPVDPGSRTIPAESENSIVVFAVDEGTGELTLIQRIDSGGVCPRTLSLDPSGSVLVVANSETYLVEGVDGVHPVPRNVVTFGVAADGRLAFAHRDQVSPAGDFDIGWAGVISHR